MSESYDSFDPELLPQSDGGPKTGREGVLRVLWRQKWLVGACAGICLILAGAYLLLATPIYQSGYRLLVQSRAAQALSQHPNGGDAPANPNFLYRQCQVITSTPILAMTLARQDVQQLRTLADVEDSFGYLEEHVNAEVGKADGLINITAQSPYPAEAKLLVDAIATTYIDYQTKQRKSTVVEALTLLRTEKEKVERELKEAAVKLYEFRKSHGDISLADDDTNNVMLQRLSALSEALTKAQLDSLNAKAAHEEALRALGKDPAKLAALARIEEKGAAVIDANEDVSLRTELLEWQAHLQELQGRFLANHPRVEAAERRVNQLNILYIAALGRKLQASQQREADILKAFEAQQKLAIARSAQAAEFQQLQADDTRHRQQVADLDKKIKDLDVTAAAATGLSIQEIEPGKVPTRPYKPNKFNILAIALAIGLLLGVSLACLRDWSDPRLHSAEEVTATLGLPVLGQVPEMPGNLAPSVRGQTILLDPSSEASEACRSLRTALQFSLRGRSAKTMLVASPNSGDGKSTLVSNLAISLAQAGRKVLIIDADLRRPAQHEIFGVEDDNGLSTVLNEESDAVEAIQQTTVANLDVLPCGPLPENPADILNSQHFADILDDLADKYDHLIVDSPPVVGVTDARIIAASCDVTLLVLKADRTNRKLAEQTRDGLMSVGGQLVGVVLNGVQPTGRGAYGGGYHEQGDDADTPRLTSNGRGKAGGPVAREGVREKVGKRSRSAPGR